MLKKISETVGIARIPSDKDLYKITDKDLKEAIKQMASEEIIKNRVTGIFLEACRMVEADGQDKRVSDVVMNAQTFSVFRKYCKDMLDVSCLAKELKKGLFGNFIGTRVWVHRDAPEIRCYRENSTEFGKHFPLLAESKKALKIKD